MSQSEFIAGSLFGGALYAAGVYSPSIIKSQMNFTSNTMITVMMGASATSAIVLDIEDRLKLMPKIHRPPSSLGFFAYDGNVLGGLMIGVGMAATGACPGTSLVQAGAGMANGVLTIMGGVLGAMAFVKLQPALKVVRERMMEAECSSEDRATHSQTSPKKPLDIATAIGIRPLILLLIWVPMCLAIMQLVFATDHSARQVPTSGLVPPAYGGLLIGLAQLGTTLLAGHTIGASAAYQDVANWINGKIFPKSSDVDSPEPAFWTPSVIFSGGVVFAATALSLLISMREGLRRENLSFIEPRKAAHSIAGGLTMVLGARIAGGCTSGHGISGLAKFSLSSLVTTVALFSAGILTAGIASY